MLLMENPPGIFESSEAYLQRQLLGGMHTLGIITASMGISLQFQVNMELVILWYKSDARDFSHNINL
jgi:hypothetical protein